MKNFLQKFNWKNFAQRTLLFFLVFLIIRFLVDWVEGDLSIGRIFRQSFLRYFIFAMILGLLDSDTWFKQNNDGKQKNEPLRFQNFRSALFHYSGVAFFISLLCGVILIVISFIRWGIAKFTGTATIDFFPEWKKYLLVIVVIGICFALYDAYRNYRHIKKQEQQS